MSSFVLDNFFPYLFRFVGYFLVAFVPAGSHVGLENVHQTSYVYHHVPIVAVDLSIERRPLVGCQVALPLVARTLSVLRRVQALYCDEVLCDAETVDYHEGREHFEVLFATGHSEVNQGRDYRQEVLAPLLHRKNDEDDQHRRIDHGSKCVLVPAHIISENKIY